MKNKRFTITEKEFEELKNHTNRKVVFKSGKYTYLIYEHKENETNENFNNSKEFNNK